MDNREIKVKLLCQDEWDSILTLSANDNQKGFIETSKRCLYDAKTNAYDISWNFFGIFRGDVLIGFAMYGPQRYKLPPFEKMWLDRFMIDSRYQGLGYGKKSLDLIIENIHKNYRHKKIYLSVCRENELAINLYKKSGFKMTFFKDPTGELIMVRTN